MIEKNIRLQPHHARDLLVGRRSDGKRPKYQPPSQGGGFANTGGGGGGGGEWSPSVSYSPPPVSRPSPHVDSAANLMAQATRMENERKAKEAAIAKIIEQEVVIPHLGGADDSGWTRAFESPTNITGDTPEERREKEFLETGDYETLIAPDLGKRIDTAPKVDLKDIMGEVTDPGSVSYDPTYKTPEEIRTLQGTTDYGQFFRQPFVVEKPKTGIGGALKTIGKGALEMALMPFLPKPVRTAWSGYKRAKQLEGLAKRTGILDKDIVPTLNLSNLRSTIDKSRPSDMPEHLGERGFRTRRETPPRDGEGGEATIAKQVAGGEDVITKAINQYRGTKAEDQIASLVQNDLNKALQYYSMMTPKIEAGKANKQEMDAYELLEFYLNKVAPKQQNVAHGGRIDRPLMGGSRYI